MSLSEQVVILFAGARGFLDKYEIEKIKDYEPELLSFIKGKSPEFMKEIDEKHEISPELEEKMKGILTEFDSVFVAG